MVKESDLNLMRAFKKDLIRSGFTISGLFLFGSRVAGKVRKDSDYDMVVVSDYFKDIGMLYRSSSVRKFWNSRFAADIMCYTPLEFEKASKNWTVARIALENGVKI